MVMTVMASVTFSGDVNAGEVPLTELTAHSPVEIDGEIELAASDIVTNGTGTWDDPYIIEGWYINATGHWNALKISNTHTHLIIRDCNLSYADYWTGGAGYVERSGLHLEGASNVTVVNVTAFDNRNGGIRLGNCRNITITDCTLMGSGRPDVTGVEGDGIIIHCSKNVLVERCVIYDNMYSDVIIDSEYSDATNANITLRDCHMSGSSFGIFVYSSDVFGFTVENCTISDFSYCGFWSRNDGLPVRQTGWVVRNITVENDDQISTFGAMHLYHLTGAIIEDVEIRHLYGTHDEEVLQLFSCDNTTVTNSWFHDNYQIALQTLSCQNITFMDSTITNGTQGGIRIDGSKDVTISGMVIDGIRSGQGRGIITMTSSRITVNDCTITNNLGHGVYVYTGTENLEVRDCVISGNGYTTSTGYGFFIYSAIEGVTVVNNTFTNNHGAGAVFDDNHVQALDAGNNNHWNDSSGGNRWSDWLGPDADYNGFVDAPYDIDGTAGAQDMLPLADPESIPPEVVITAPGNGAILTSTDVTVEWGAWDNQTGLDRIEVTVDSDAPTDVGLNTSMDLSLSEGAHTVMVTAYDAMGNDGSDSVSFSITLPTVPGAPTGLTATPLNSSAFLEWNAPSNGGSVITSYHVYRGTDPG
ncbi:MAG: right-handed parallel beta-helix repeat-containing protein, partial [Methanomassiliicoccales archaeon]|nr:right-handed parallel beta-helix repeat-containing protein [Methanomassiliicoccales archaeon]